MDYKLKKAIDFKLNKIKKDIVYLGKWLLILLSSLVFSIIMLVTIFYVIRYLPSKESDILVDLIKYLFFLTVVFVFGFLIYSEKNIRFVETIEEMQNRFDIRFLSIVLASMIILPSAALIQYFFQIVKGPDSIFVVSFVLIVFEGVVTRSAIAEYVFKKINKIDN